MSENQSLQPTAAPSKPVEQTSWKTAYDRTVWELNTEKLLTAIHATEAALFERWQQLSDEPGHDSERAAMKVASQDLLAIKIHRLGWPDPCALPGTSETGR